MRALFNQLALVFVSVLAGLFSARIGFSFLLVFLLTGVLAGEDGLALIPQLAPAAVLVLSSHGDAATRQRAARQGAGAFTEKHQPAAELLGALLRLVTP